jgi:hypothetical protein
MTTAMQDRPLAHRADHFDVALVLATFYCVGLLANFMETPLAHGLAITLNCQTEDMSSNHVTFRPIICHSVYLKSST